MARGRGDEDDAGAAVRKPYIREMPTTWWLQKRVYFMFMMREFTAVFAGAYAVLLLVMLWKLKLGEMAQFVDWLHSPLLILFHLVALVFAIYNTITTFNAMPQVMPIRLGEDKVPAPMLIAPNYVAWVVVSIALVFIMTRPIS